MWTRVAIGTVLTVVGCGVDRAGVPGDAPPIAPGGPYFAAAMFFDEDVSAAPKAARSDAIISSLVAAGGWGNHDQLEIDFALDVLTATAETPTRPFVPTEDFFSPDCDLTGVPVPPDGNLEDERGYACTGNGDCHLLVFEPGAMKLYEMWRADIRSTFRGGCLAVWDGRRAYDDRLRGEQCTSADAAGFPIAPLLFTADEVAAGRIGHAIRFILPGDRIQRGYVRPATHATSTTGDVDAPHFGVHLRLRADYLVAGLPRGAQVVARALQTYGMYLADGGNYALTAQSDRHTTAKWAGLLEPGDLSALRVTDFEVIDHGPPFALTYHCAR